MANAINLTIPALSIRVRLLNTPMHIHIAVLSHSGIYDKTVTNFISKGARVTQPTNILNKIKSVNVNTWQKLFNALVLSTVLHAAAV